MPYRGLVLFKNRERFCVRVLVASEELIASLVKGRRDESSVKLYRAAKLWTELMYQSVLTEKIEPRPSPRFACE